MIRKFDSVSSLLDYVSTAETSPIFRGERLLSSDKYEDNWHGTASLQEALQLAAEGDFENAKLIKNAPALRLTAPTAIVRKRTSAVAGGTVNIPRFLANAPKCFNRRRKTPTEKRVIDIILSYSIAGGVSSKELANAAAAVLSQIQAIEAAAQFVALTIEMAAYKQDEISACFVRLKPANRKANALDFAFPIVNPSMFRRVFLRFIEADETLKDKKWPNSYGYCMRGCDARKLANEQAVNYDIFLNLQDCIGKSEEQIRELFQK